MKYLLWTVACAGLAGAAAGSATAQTPAGSAGSTRPDTIVVTATPLEGADTDARSIAAPVQTATAKTIEDSHALDVTAYMNRALGSVYVNDIQNNPLQPDVNYRGYTASPLLGTPEGLSVYLDGVRQNQPFGDVVSWDLIPREAIESLTLMPGSNPLFGLNTLGGALSVRTKSGISAPGSAIELGYGSNNRWQAQASTGGSADNGFDWFVTGNRFEDDGWRDASPSEATQLFGKAGWRNDRTHISLTGAYADTDLTGNGMQDQRLLAADYRSVYTKPDNTANRSSLLNLTAQHRLSDHIQFSGNLYYRKITTHTLNGDINDDSLTEQVYQPDAEEQDALTAAGYTGFPTSGEDASNTPFPSWRCIANILLNSAPNEICNGLLNRSHTSQDEAGASGQMTVDTPLGARANTFTAGAAYNASHAHFIQSTQFGYLTPDRGVATVDGPGAFADGTQESEDAQDARVDLTGRTHVWSVFATDTMEVVPTLRLTLSGRYDASRVKTYDSLTPSGPGSLTGNHDFSRFNPAIGVTWSPNDGLTAYAGYNEGSRAPSAIELGCSDPDNPCRLPNALAGDPPLKQVVARTVEAGVRGRGPSGLAWNAGFFRAENSNDIMFVADDISGFGYFRNFGKTRRQGVELGASGEIGAVSLGANYTYLDATYRSAEVVPGQGNSTNDGGPGFEGAIAVSPGDRIPLVPRQIFKANARWEATSRFALEADAIAVDGSYARGNENNQHQPDGVYYLGSGKTGGYAVMNLGADFRPVRSVKLFVQVNNVFDTRYHTAAQLGSTGFTETGAFLSRPFSGPVVDGELPTLGETFYAPGAPRLIWAGVRYSF
ncbi:MAG: TonB-dependent receptor plug domain-containing protein [Alphaproteobacteria bacterium]|nr:TonB-dependent receptor plug domain-containing protein [Alphaproteobacteria bacterium]